MVSGYLMRAHCYSWLGQHTPEELDSPLIGLALRREYLFIFEQHRKGNTRGRGLETTARRAWRCRISRLQIRGACRISPGGALQRFRKMALANIMSILRSHTTFDATAHLPGREKPRCENCLLALYCAGIVSYGNPAVGLMVKVGSDIVWVSQVSCQKNQVETFCDVENFFSPQNILLLAILSISRQPVIS